MSETKILFFQQQFRQIIDLFKRSAAPTSNTQSIQMRNHGVQRVTPGRYQIHIQRAFQFETIGWRQLDRIISFDGPEFSTRRKKNIKQTYLKTLTFHRDL